LNVPKVIFAAADTAPAALFVLLLALPSTVLQLAPTFVHGPTEVPGLVPESDLGVKTVGISAAVSRVIGAKDHDEEDVEEVLWECGLGVVNLEEPAAACWYQIRIREMIDV